MGRIVGAKFEKDCGAISENYQMLCKRSCHAFYGNHE